MRRSRLFCVVALVLLGGCVLLGKKHAVDAVREVRLFNTSLIVRSPSAASAKFRKMGTHILSFNRGVNHLFYRHVQTEGLPLRWMGPRSQAVFLQGDFHVENVGAYRDGQGAVVAALLDFDDAFEGPAILDVYRCASSLHLAMASDGMKKRMVRAFTDSYADTMVALAEGLKPAPERFAVARDIVARAQGMTDKDFFEQVLHARVQGGRHAFGYHPQYQEVPPRLTENLMESYMADRASRGLDMDPAYYVVQDAVVARGSGIGSAGSYKVLVLVAGPSADPYDDVALEFKEQAEPAGMAYAVRRYEHQGRRVLQATQTLQASPQGQIGVATVGERQFFASALLPTYAELAWRELQGSLEMHEAAQLAGMLLAQAHARNTPDGAVARESAQLVGADKKGFFKDVLRFCVGYGKFLEKGYKEFTERLVISPILWITGPRRLAYAA